MLRVDDNITHFIETIRLLYVIWTNYPQLHIICKFTKCPHAGEYVRSVLCLYGQRFSLFVCFRIQDNTVFTLRKS